MGWALALHGGAGDISRSMDLEKRQKVEEALQEYLELGISALKSSHSALDVVELVVRQLENNPVFNAGRGSVLTCAGTVEMEACIMNGPSKASGAVSGLSTVVNPISLARLVMEKTPHVYLAFEGAEKFARKQGVEVMDPSYFITDANVKRLHAAQQANIVQLDHSASSMSEDGKVENGETVGCVAVDQHGNCAAATSTGGLVNKMVGRIGDTPLVGAGNYANNLCAISATGKGEAIIRAMVSYEIAALMELKSMSLSEAVNNVIGTKLGKGNGGVVAVSSDGDVVTAFNTTGMYRASANSAGEYEMGIW